MKTPRKIFYKGSLFVLLLLLPFTFAFSFQWEVEYPGNPPQYSFPDYVQYIYEFSFIFAAFLATLMLIIGGLQLIMASGNPQQVIIARQKILNSILGLILLFLSYTIVLTINPDLLVLKNPPIILPQKNSSTNNSSNNGWDYLSASEIGVGENNFQIKKYDNDQYNVNPGCKLKSPLEGEPNGRLINPEFIILHWTGNVSDSFNSVYNYFNLGAPYNNCYWEAFVPFMVDKNGIIYQSSPANLRQAGTFGYNDKSINIEGIGKFCDYGQTWDCGEPSQGQKESYLKLVKALMKKYNIKACDVYGHYELNPGNKSDPGKKFMEYIWQNIGTNPQNPHSGCQNRGYIPPEQYNPSLNCDPQPCPY